jgi:hypothetical protein
MAPQPLNHYVSGHGEEAEVQGEEVILYSLPCSLLTGFFPTPPASLEIADTEKRESRICRTQLLQKSVKASLTA